MAHVLKVALVEIITLLRQEEVYQIIVAFQVLGAYEEKSLSLLTLLIELRVH